MVLDPQGKPSTQPPPQGVAPAVPPPPDPPKQPAGRWQIGTGWIVTGIVGAALAVVVFFASGFFVGQSTRKSAEQVAKERTEAVNVAVVAAVDRKGEEDKKLRLRMMARQETKLKARNRSVIRRVVRKMKRSGARKADEAYASGSAVGRNEGFETGVDAGIEKASDDVVCSDDPDVPLPYC
ncbi:MAG: hypothetical protein ACSLFR_00005 [Solirubrobacteraceae bacterium]